MEEKIYCVEYSKSQKAFHIQSIQDRLKRPRFDWNIIFKGTQDECWNKLKIIREEKCPLCLKKLHKRSNGLVCKNDFCKLYWKNGSGWIKIKKLEVW
jgi:hypothetical protein